MKTTDTETTADGFRKLHHDIVFIAGSQDIKPLRSAVEWAIKNAIHQLAQDTGIRPFSWDIELSDEGFDQAKSMQKNLPRPSDEKCLGVVCLMAERIGHPLEQDFDIRMIDGVESWTNPDHRYRLLHPWPDSLEEQENRIEEGCYPLTGTVFEFIDAYSAGKPVKFCVIADSPIEPNGHQSVKLGNFQLRKTKAGTLEDEKFDAWKKNDYNLQTAAVKNFVCALVKKGIDQNAIQDHEKVVEDIKKFVAREILKNSIQNINPYRFLNYFDVFDADHFYGRDKLSERAVQDLWSRFNSTRYQNVVRIVGHSGAGKSSFLRAGLIARFQRPEYRGDVRAVVFRPTDFQQADGAPFQAIRSILEFVEKQTDIAIPPGPRADVWKQGPRAAQLAIELLQGLLPKATDGGTSRLVFGIDQFEEIVDYLSDKQKQAQWHPIVQFIEAAGRSESIGVAYTLESSRKSSLSQLGLPEVFMESDEIEVEGYTSEFIRSIIEEPFRKAGYPLGREVVKKLEDLSRELKPEEGPRTEQSILPLIALKLSKLFDHVQTKRAPAANVDLAEASGVAFDEKAASNPAFIQLADVEGELDFGSLIEDEARKAWREGTGTSIAAPGAIDFFLQPLVGIGGPNLGHLQLQTMRWPVYPAEQNIARSFKRRRLLAPAANGLRLVHEAVIRYWPDALNWFKNKKDFLKKEALYRQKANEWSSNGRPAEVEFITQDDVEDAAEILSPYLRDWGLRQGSADSLSEYDKLLRDYCLFVFRQSRTPDKAIKYMAKPAGTHVFRAAQYGMVGLLDAFRQIDPACLELPNNDTGNTPLHGAAWAHADTVEYLLRQGVAPAPRNNKGWTPIAAPILMGRMDIFRLLLKASKPEELDAPNGRNLLHICAEYGRVDMAHLLIYEGLDPGLPDDRRWKPFHYAANSGELEALKFFGKFSDITETTGQGFNALHLAAANGHAAVVHYLLNEPRFHQHYNARTEEGKTALHLAAENRHGEVVSLLLQACDPNEPVSKAQSGPGQNFRPLHLAINGRGYSSASDDPDPIFETAAALLDDGRTDPNLPDGRGRTPLQMAASFPKLQKLLLRHPKLEAAQPISEGGETPITVSAKLGDWESFRALTKRSGHVASELADEAGNTMLHLLSERNAPPDLIENTLANLAPEGLNTLNKEGLTPLFSAIKSKNWMLVRKLLEFKGIDPTLKGERKPTALMLALELKADKDTLDTLVRVAPSLFTETDYFGWTPLHRAVAFQQTDWINWLQNNAEEPKTLWEQTDLLGRRPMGLASPSIKKKLGSSRESGNWPRPRSWDSGLEWKPIKAEDKEKLKARIDPVDGQFTVDEHADAHTAVLSFYDPEKVRIIRVKSPAWNYSGLNVYYLEYEENLFRLNGTSPPIHELNSKAGISLNPENVLDYLRFFCFFVRGEGGPFLIAEGLAQEEIPSSLTEVEREALEKVLRPACYNGYDEERGEFLAIATIYYSNSVFFADFAIRNTGMIEMIEDLNAIENLSAGIARPLK